MTLPNSKPDYNQVTLRYFIRVLLELLADGKTHTAELMMDGVRFDDNYATWERTI